ncbi:hypothetical protein KUCAC02_033031 [Chaenocephalus aceratus]|nr:hypothetical protein KUCAC02_033031 [Chaenocephalus aceratus]
MALHFSSDGGLCIPDLESDAWWLGVLSYTFVMGFALPFTVMTASYAALLLTMRSQWIRMTTTTTTPNFETHRAESQVTKMVVAVVVVFGICWLPFYTLNFYALYQTGLYLTFARAFELIVLLSRQIISSMQCNTERYDLNDASLTILA